MKKFLRLLHTASFFKKLLISYILMLALLTGALLFLSVNLTGTISNYSSQHAHNEALSYQSALERNLDSLQSKFTKEPYDVWIKKADGVEDSVLYDYIWSHSELQAESVEYLGQEIIEAKNDPLLQGFNGMLTLGFIITMFICVIGFLIYWILSIKTRTLQFGVFRAMGMSVKNVIGMILCEQGLISLVSILAGVILGGFTSDLFVPMLEMVYSVSEQVPEFVVVASRADYGKIYLIIAFMLLLGIAILSRIIIRTKIDQALKLGED